MAIILLEQNDVTFLLINLHLFVQHVHVSPFVVHLEQCAPDYNLQALALALIKNRKVHLFP